MKQEGKAIDEGFLTNLIYKRTQQKDCMQRGWVLEDYPQTREQAIYMAKADLQPTNVFYLRVPQEEVYRRTQADSIDQFECSRAIVAHRLRHLEQNLPHVLGFYNRVYNNLIEIDGTRSVWYMEDRAITAIQANFKSRQDYATNLFYNKPCLAQNIHFDRCIFKNNLSQFGYFCPVTWKNQKQLMKCIHNPELCVYYENLFYYFRGQSERNMFVANPRRFINNVIFSSAKGIPTRFKHHKAAEITAQEKAIIGYCPVTLVDEGRVCKGDNLLVVQYKDNKF
jgi:adenylate kinase family enzyme